MYDAEKVGIEFVPMLWGPSEDRISAWHRDRHTWADSTKNVLFFNEPNLNNSVVAAGISAAASVQYWVNDYLPVRYEGGGRSLGGASPTNAPDGIDWVLNLIKECISSGRSARDCTPDFAPVHFYISDVNEAKAYMEKYHQKTGLPLWITEYACASFEHGSPASSPDAGGVMQYNKELVAWMDQQDYIVRYAPFGE